MLCSNISITVNVAVFYWNSGKNIIGYNRMRNVLQWQQILTANAGATNCDSVSAAVAQEKKEKKLQTWACTELTPDIWHT